MSRFAKLDAKLSPLGSEVSHWPDHLCDISSRLAIIVSNAGGRATPLYRAWARSILPAIKRQNENCGLVNIGEKERNCCPIVAISEAASRHVSADEDDGSLTGHIRQ